MLTKIEKINDKIEELSDRIFELEQKKIKIIYKQTKKELLEKLKVGDIVYKEIKKEPYDTSLTKVYCTLSRIEINDEGRVVNFYDKNDNLFFVEIFKLREDKNSGYFWSIMSYEGELKKYVEEIKK